MPFAETASGELQVGIRSRIRRGEVLVGMMVFEFFTPLIPRILVDAGLDFAVFDMESSGLSFRKLEVLAALSHGVGLAPFVRTSTADPAEVGRALDLGAAGIMAPKIGSVAEAKRFVDAVRFPPEGTRGSGYGAYLHGYVSTASEQTRARINAEAVTICQLESLEGIADAEAIAELEGVDVLNVGRNDLAAELGVSSKDARVRESADLVGRAASRRGKPILARATAGAPLPAEHRLILIDHDTAALAAHVRASVAGVRK